MKKFKVKRQASVGSDGIYFHYSLYYGDSYVSLEWLWKYFPSLTSEEVEREIKSLIGKRKIDPACLGSIICDVREKTSKNKKEIRKAHKKIMGFYRELLERLEMLEKEKSLTEWLWEERCFDL